MQPLTLMLVSLLACARAHQVGEESSENVLEVPNNYLDPQTDESSLLSQPISDEKTALNVLLRTILHNRPARSSFHFQPQRFGRDERSSMLGDSRIHLRGWDSMAPQFWSMAVPQRFGRKK
ncbi:pro-FMRFamide-related neuropeptide FF [Rhinophrynus dorsalis]